MSPFVFACTGAATQLGAASVWSYNIIAWTQAEAQALALEIATGMHGPLFNVAFGSCTKSLDISGR